MGQLKKKKIPATRHAHQRWWKRLRYLATMWFAMSLHKRRFLPAVVSSRSHSVQSKVFQRVSLRESITNANASSSSCRVLSRFQSQSVAVFQLVSRWRLISYRFLSVTLFVKSLDAAARHRLRSYTWKFFICVIVSMSAIPARWCNMLPRLTSSNSYSTKAFPTDQK